MGGVFIGKPCSTSANKFLDMGKFSIFGKVTNKQGVQENLCFFTIHCNPSLAYIAGRHLQRSQHNASVPSVQPLLLAGNFCTTNSSRVLARERWQTFKNSLKTQFLMNTL